MIGLAAGIIPSGGRTGRDGIDHHLLAAVRLAQRVLRRAPRRTRATGIGSCPARPSAATIYRRYGSVPTAVAAS
jgi:hypothetical protein